MQLTFNQHVSIPVLSGCRPMPNMRSHTVKDRARDSENGRHRLRVTLVEGSDVLVYCRHWLCRTRHTRFPFTCWCRVRPRRCPVPGTLLQHHCIWSSISEKASLSL